MTSVTAESDEQLLIRIGTKDRAALEELYHRYRRPLSAFLSRKIYANKLVDEAFNDCMFAVWRNAGGFRGDSKASTWIFGIAYRVALTTARKESKHTNNRVDNDPQEYEVAEEYQPSDELNEDLAQAINTLKEKHKTVIELAYFHDKSLDEVAMIIDVPVNTVKTRLFYARQYLKKYLENMNSEQQAQQV